MKNLIIILCVFLAVSLSAPAQISTKPSKGETQKTTYTCPMHPNERSEKEGNCSKCGMDLVKSSQTKHNSSVKGSQSSSKIVSKYVCTMDGSTSQKPGKCSKCGMGMKKADEEKNVENHKH